MKTVSMLEFRNNALEIVKGVKRGQSVLLTYRGEPVARLEPPDSSPQADDPSHALADLAAGRRVNLTTRYIDELTAAS